MASIITIAVISAVLLANSNRFALGVRLVHMNGTHLRFFNISVSLPQLTDSETEVTTTASSRTTTNMPIRKTTKLPWPDLACDFDSLNTCGWKNPRTIHDMDDFDWRTGSGRDAHRRRTGTKDDHGGGGGYLYIKSGSNRNRTAKILSNMFFLPKPGCLKFWYHMRGKHMGHLKVYESRDLKGQIPFKIMSIHKGIQLPQYLPLETINYKPLWSVYGAQGGEWLEAVVPVRKSPYRKLLVFEAFDWDGGKMGNILLDDITFEPIVRQSDCILSPADAAPPTTIPPATKKLATSTTNQPALQTKPTESTTGVLANADTSKPVTSESQATAIPNQTSTKTTSKGSKLTTQATTRPKSSKQDGAAVEKGGTAAPTGVVAPDNRSKIYIAVAVVGLFLILGVSLLLLVVYRRRQRFSYYDNCTVAMTKMNPEIVKVTEHTIEYRKLM